MEVVQLRTAPRLTDIPGQLRQLADSIESGEVKAEHACICIIDQEQDWPTIFGWGETKGMLELIGLLELAKAWLVKESV